MGRRPVATIAMLGLASMLLAGCGGDGEATGATADGAPDAVEATPPDLAAAVVARYDAPLTAAVALRPGRSERLLTEDSLAVELAFDRPEGDNTHISVMVFPTDPFAGNDYAFPDCSVFDCEDMGTDEVDATLVYENGAPEEDPGVVAAVADWGDRFVLVSSYGPFVSPLAGAEERDPEVVALGEAVAAIATDPAVGFRTSQTYAAGGEQLCDSGDWLDWFGQNNGSAEPEDWVDYC